MTCQDFNELLSTYLDRELAAPDAALMAAHAETCARCQNERTSILTMKSAMRERVMPGIPADLLAAIEAKTIHNPSWWERNGLRARWLPIAVGAATAVGALWLSKAQQNTTPRATLPVAMAPSRLPSPVLTRIPLSNQEPSNPEKGDSREN